MKMIVLFCVLTLGLFSTSLSQEYGWTDISTNIPTDADLSDVFFVSDDEGWITSSSHAEIYHTIDGGETFEIQTTQLSTEAIHMLNENEGYCGGASGFIYKTTDGGINWNFHGTIGATLADITFPPTGYAGYACGMNGAISKITSSGVTPMNSGVPDHLSSITSPVNSSNGKVCGGSIIRTLVNGSWEGNNVYSSGGYNAIYMADTLTGWAVGDEGIIIHTTDGISWFEQTNPDTSTYRTLRNLFFLNSQDGWAVGTASIIHTTNGGATWTIEGVGYTTANLRGVHFTSPTNGYVAGNLKTLLKYTEISGIGDAVEQLKFEINPNPTQNIIQIKCSEFKTESGNIEILSIDSKKILEKEIEAGIKNIELDLNNLKSGMYLCKITIGNRGSTKIIIKE